MGQVTKVWLSCHFIAKSGNKTVAPSWPDPCVLLLQFNSQALLALRSSCELENNIVSVERVSEYINLPTEVRDKWLPTLLWRHNERDSVSNHQRLYCLLKRLFRRRPKVTSKLRVTGLCAWNSPGTGEFPAQKASNAEYVSIWWRHHEIAKTLGSTSIRYLSDTEVSDRYLIDVDPSLFAIWVLFNHWTE